MEYTCKNNQESQFAISIQKVIKYHQLFLEQHK